MTKIKEDLLNSVEKIMIPEVEAYIDEIHNLMKENKSTEDNLNEVREMESFLVELHNIIQAINENKIDDQEANKVYEKIQQLINEHEEH